MDNVKNSNHDWLGFKKRNFLALLSLPFLLLSIISFFLAGWPAIFSSVALAFGISGLALRIYKPQVKGKIISSIVILLSSIVLVLSMLVVLVWLSQSYNPPAFAYAIPSVILMIVGYSILIIALFIRLQAKAKFLFAGGIIFLINAVYLWLLPRVIL